MRFADFDRVTATRFFHVTVQVGDRYAVSVRADDNLYEYISVTQKGSELIFGLRSSGLGIPGSYTLRSGTLEATVTLPKLAAAAARDNAQLTIPTCRVDTLAVAATANGALHGSFEANDLRVDGDGNSFVRLSGSARSVDITGKGNGNLDLSGLEVGSARVDLDDLSQAAIKVQDRLDYNVAGLAHLTYQGSPQIGKSSQAGSAGVTAL